MHFGVLETFLTILFITLVVTVIFRYIHLPVILGYLIVGVIVGPHVLAWIPNKTEIKILADLGVVFLMFTVGLEFSISKLLSLKKSVFLVGTLQVFICIAITVWLGQMLYINKIASFIIGSIIAMSSTAIVLKQLHDQEALNTPASLHAIGILLFQDLAVIPILMLIAMISNGTQETLAPVFIWSLLKGVSVIAFMLIFGRWLLRPLFHLLNQTHHIELFMLGVLFVAVGSAWLTNYLGLSYALGAFISGIMLAECEHTPRIKAEVRPFRDILLGLFFISIGMLVNVTIWPSTWRWILLVTVALLLGKSLLIFIVSFATRYDIKIATRTSLILAEGGEFGFAILTVALSHQLMPATWGQSILGGLLLSFLIAPLLIRHHEKIAEFLLR